MTGPSLADTLNAIHGVWGESLVHAALAAARALPLVLLVPAFGLRALPLPARLLFAAALGIATVPMGATVDPLPESLLLALVHQMLIGLPVALATATLLWAATMAGDLFAVVRGAFHPQSFSTVEGPSSLFGILFSLLASIAFLQMGGATRVVRALIAAEPAGWAGWGSLLEAVVRQVAHSIELAIVIAAPLIAIALACEMVFALTARAATSLALASVLPAFRGLVVLAALGLLFQALAWALFEMIDLGLPQPGL